MTSDSSDMTTLDSEDWKSEDLEKEKKRKAIAMLKEPKDFKPEDYRVVLKCDKQMAKGQLKGGTVVNFDELPFSKHADSVQNAIDAWQWIIAPMKVDEFFELVVCNLVNLDFVSYGLGVSVSCTEGRLCISLILRMNLLSENKCHRCVPISLVISNIFENKTLVVHRKNPQYYGNLYSTKKFVKILQEHYLEYGTHVNAAVYIDGERYTPNGIGKVYPNEIRAHLNVAIRVVHRYIYLTPAGTAGFAPHWDEIDAFLMQVEGRKHWKVFAPVGEGDALPRDSSGNFSDSDLAGRTPVFDGWIEQGDLIYIPRGFIHQGYTDASTHSLHLTVSVCRRDAFVDLLEKFLPVAISSLADETLSMRRSMPTRYMDMCGVLPLKYALEKKAKPKILSVLEKQLDALKQGVSDAYESAIDMMAREYLKTAIPPLLTKEERELSVTGGEGFDILNKKETKFTTKTKVKFIRRHAQRLIFESEDRCYVVHRMTNSRIYEGRPEVTFGLDADLSDGFASLLETYPDWCSVGSIECETDEQRIQLAKVLYGNGIMLLVLKVILSANAVVLWKCRNLLVLFGEGLK
ncbi:unnamed protein product [Anisakis simplex]|uniref:Bifunctional lysine-specific demethylase and histidyl-hydroxylase n=1 Tax=Anisakis simplex TaxID=6269 RepID=A0A0M3KAU8_ANISI|nr:unnamed protein product [Anisakis simplex]